MSVRNPWWEPYEESRVRGSVMGIWSALDEQASLVDEAIDEALRVDAANWFAKKGGIR